MERPLDIIYIVADYGRDDRLAWVEVHLALREEFPGVVFEDVPVPAFNTLAAGFVADQLAHDISRGKHPGRSAMLINVDPRTQTSDPVHDGAGAPFLHALLCSGINVFSPNAGFSLSILKPRIIAVEELMRGNGSGQFRSRDDFPALMFDVLHHNRHSEMHRDLSLIPDPPAGYQVLRIDGYGNLKLSMTLSQARACGFKEGQTVQVCVRDGLPRQAICAPSIMGGAFGQLVLAPGSSGDPKDLYIELAVRAGPDYVSAHAMLGRITRLEIGTTLTFEFTLQLQPQSAHQAEGGHNGAGDDGTSGIGTATPDRPAEA